MNQNRMVVVESVYHQHLGEQATSTENRYSRILQSDDMPYVRRAQIGETWEPIDTGWLEAVSQMLLRNEGDPPRSTNPTELEKEAAAAKVLEVGLFLSGNVHEVFEVPPGESIRCSPLVLKEFWQLRCRKGTTRYTLTLLPS